jgi:hypothetical protein
MAEKSLVPAELMAVLQKKLADIVRETNHEVSRIAVLAQSAVDAWEASDRKLARGLMTQALDLEYDLTLKCTACFELSTFIGELRDDGHPPIVERPAWAMLRIEDEWHWQYRSTTHVLAAPMNIDQEADEDDPDLSELLRQLARDVGHVRLDDLEVATTLPSPTAWEATADGYIALAKPGVCHA